MLRTCPRCGEDYGTTWVDDGVAPVYCRCHRRLFYALIFAFGVALAIGFCIGKVSPPNDPEIPKTLYRESNSRARKTLVSVEEDHLRIVTGEVRDR